MPHPLDPSPKNEAIYYLLDFVMPGRSAAMKAHNCAICGKHVEVEDFRDEKSITEYTISAMCQRCQDDFQAGCEDNDG